MLAFPLILLEFNAHVAWLLAVALAVVFLAAFCILMLAAWFLSKRLG